MTDEASLESAVWERLLKIKPSLPRHAQIQQRYYGDDLWYILNDKSSGKFHRFNVTAYQLLGFMNGHNNLELIIDSAAKVSLEQGLGDPPSKEELVELLQYLYVADLLVCDFPPSTEEMFNRKQRKSGQFWQQLIKNPYVWKFSVFNPDKLLDFLMPLARIVASPAMGFIWLSLVVYACLQVGNHWSELSQNSFSNILSPQNLFLLWITYPIIKVIHELGHGLFTKAWGGNVHEFGVVFILGTPLPYVDATAATGFPKGQRLMVGAAGMAVELFFAAIAFILWLNTPEGVFRDILFNIMLIGSVSTLFFNGNPLMRFDGYHILCDAIDQPNLAARALQQLRYIIRHYGYNMRALHSPSHSLKEAWGLSVYGILAFLYRLLILVSIVIIVSNNFPKIGVVFACWLGFFQFVLPLSKHIIYLFFNKDLDKYRFRAVVVTSLAVVLLVVILFAIPVSYKTSAQGVVWLPESARIQARSQGEVVEFLVKDGSVLTQGQAVARLSNKDLTSSLLTKKFFLKEYQARYEESWSENRSQGRLFEQDIGIINSEIKHLQSQVDNLVIRSPSEGVYRAVSHHQMLGSFIRQGDTVGLVVNKEPPRIRVALKQREIGLVKLGTLSVEVYSASHPSNKFIGIISQEVPKATFVLPSPVLGTGGGGRIVIDGSKQGSTSAAQRIFLVDVALPLKSIGDQYFGMRVNVAFIHSPEALFKRILRSIRHTFMGSTHTE